MCEHIIKMEKGLIVTQTASLRFNFTKLKIILAVPLSLDFPQIRAYETDFRQKMAYLALHLQSEIDRPTSNDNAVALLFSNQTAIFTVGAYATVNGQQMPVVARIKKFIDAYCCLYDFKWSFQGTVNPPDYSRRAAASAQWASVVPVALRL